MPRRKKCRHAREQNGPKTGPFCTRDKGHPGMHRVDPVTVVYVLIDRHPAAPMDNGGREGKSILGIFHNKADATLSRDRRIEIADKHSWDVDKSSFRILKFKVK